MTTDNTNPSAKPTIVVAIGLVFDTQQRILIAKRPPTTSYAGLWEFPGGKVEAHENIFQGLCREFHEEVGIHIEKADPFLHFIDDNINYELDIHVWHIQSYHGQAQGCENQEIRWAAIDTLPSYSFPQANSVIIKALPQLLLT